MFRNMSMWRMGMVMAMCAVTSAVWAADGNKGLVRTAEGRWIPARGYTWVAPNDPLNLQVKVRADLRLDHYDATGQPFFVPNTGFVWDNPQNLTTRVWAGLRLTGLDQAGNPWFVPAPGYLWDGDPQKTNMRIKLRPDLRIAATGLDSIGVSFRPAPGYVWVGDPNMLVTRVRSDLRVHHYFADGSASFIPAPAYMWVGEPNNLVTHPRPHIVVAKVNEDGEPVFKTEWGYLWVNPDDPNNFDVKLRTGIVENGHGFSPAPGYSWLHPEDKSDLSVMPAPGFGWVSSNPRDLRVARADRGDIHPGVGGSADRANRSPAMGAGMPHNVALGQMVGEGMKHTRDIFEQHNAELEAVGRMTHPEPRASSTPSGNHEPRGGNNNGGNGNGGRGTANGGRGRGGPNGNGAAGSVNR